jgi:hypothetical protein
VPKGQRLFFNTLFFNTAESSTYRWQGVGQVTGER